MKWHRINALLMRHIYLNKKSFPRLMDLLFWPMMSLFLWGFVSIYLGKINSGGLNIVTFLLGAVLLWEILQEGQHAVSIAFLEDVWQKNLLNIFVTPLTIGEYLTSTALFGLIRLLVAGTVMVVVAFIFYSFNIFTLGFYLIPFALNLLIFGWVLGILAIGIILRYGSSANSLAWAMLFIIQPFTAVFYPLSTLPKVMQYIAVLFPSTHVFEGMRQVISTGAVPPNNLIAAFSLNIIYLILVMFFFNKMFSRIKEKGLLLKLD